MTTFNDFASRIFPGDDLGPLRNPLPEDPAVEIVLEEVSRCTKIPLDWLRKSAQAVLEGLAGLGCLWYLHGAEGTIDIGGPEAKDPPKEFNQEILNITKQAAFDKEQKAKHDIDVWYNIDWAEATIREGRHDWTEKKRLPERTMRLGKWLRKHGASDELIHQFEIRRLPLWEWRISTHPYDILTMSHERPWTSCMRPGEAYEYGPLTDMAAGSALMFFYRPGADVACGRLILRPVATQYALEIEQGGVVYGSGPKEIPDDLLTELLAEASGHRIQVMSSGICQSGHEGEALTRGIYSDTDNKECLQYKEEYEDAYENLGAVEWPPSKLVDELPEVVHLL